MDSVGMKRGEIWWARLPNPAGKRPVVLISRDSAYTIRTNITVAEVSTVVRGIPSEVPLSKRDGMPKKCAANADNILTIPKIWLESRITALTPEKVAALDASLSFSLGLPGHL